MILKIDVNEMVTINELQSVSIIIWIFSGDEKMDEERGQSKWQYLFKVIKKWINYSVL